MYMNNFFVNTGNLNYSHMNWFWAQTTMPLCQCLWAKVVCFDFVLAMWCVPDGRGWKRQMAGWAALQAIKWICELCSILYFLKCSHLGLCAWYIQSYKKIIFHIVHAFGGGGGGGFFFYCFHFLFFLIAGYVCHPRLKRTEVCYCFMICF